MKKILLTLLLGVTTLTTFAQVPSYVPTSGLVGWWPFNGNADDESGNGNNGTVNGATLTADRNGVANKAYSFDGLDDYIQIFDSPNLRLNKSTINIWIKYSSLSKMCLIIKQNINDATNSNYGFEINDYGQIAGIGPRLMGMYQTNCGFQTAWTNICPNIDLSQNGWHLLTGILDYNKISIYIDSEFISSINTTEEKMNACSGSDLLIARGWKDYPLYYKGEIDDIAIYNRALTQEEITALYLGCTTPTASITPQSTTTFCQGGSVVLNASTGAGYTYEWYKDGNLINSETTSSYTANQSGSYTVKVINGACNATSSATTVTVNPNPTVSLSLANLIHIKAAPVTLSGSPSGGTYSGPGVVGSTFSSTNAGLGKKTITYNYTTGAGCSGSATAITTVAPNNLGKIKIWPNPANDHITIDNGNFSILNGYSVKIETVLGQEVFKSAINQQQFSVDLSTWKGKGIYLVHILDAKNNIIETKKIILQ